MPDASSSQPSLQELLEAKHHRERRNTALVILGLAGLAVLVLAWWFVFGRPDPRLAGIPPKDNGDGTVDYTIRTWGDKSGIVGQKDDILWVIRLPKDAHVDDSWDDTGSKISVAGGPTMTFGPRPRNTSLFFQLDPSTLELAKTNNPDSTKHLFTAVNDRIFPPEDWRHIDKVHFDAELCRRIESGIANIDFFVPVDAAAYAKLQAQKPGQYIGECQGRDDAPVFSLKDSSQEIVARGNCNDKNCNALIWLPTHRSASFIAFPRSALPNLAAYRDNLIRFFDEHTVRLDPYQGQGRRKAMSPDAPRTRTETGSALEQR